MENINSQFKQPIGPLADETTKQTDAAANKQKRNQSSADAASSSTSFSSSSSSRRFPPPSSPFPRFEQFLLRQLNSADAAVSGWNYCKHNIMDQGEGERKHTAAAAANTAAAISPSAATSPSPLLSRTATFTLSGHRYCGNIGRSHRSNGVYFVFDLNSRTATQRRWDADCRYFRSQPIVVTNWIWWTGKCADQR